MTKVFLTQKQKFDVGLKLSQICIKTDNGAAVYAQGWSDEAVAQHFGAPVKAIHVRSLRRDLVGNLNKQNGARKGESYSSRLTAIEEYLTSKNPNWKVS